MFIGWKERAPLSTCPPVMWPIRAPSAVVAGGRASFTPRVLGRGETSGQQPHRRAFHIAFHAGDLAGEPQAEVGLQPQAIVKKAWTVEEGVAVQAAQAREHGPLQARDGPEDLALRAVLQLGLEADHVPQGRQRIVLAQLRDRVGLVGRAMGVGQAHRLHRPVAQRLAAALGHHLDRQAPVEIGDGLPVLELALRPGQQGVDEGLVLRARHGAVDVGRGVAARPFLVIARLLPGDAHVDALGMDDLRDGVEERQLVLAGEAEDRLAEGRGGEGAGGHDHALPLGGRRPGDLAPLETDQGMGEDAPRHRLREAVAVHRQGAARRRLMGVAARHDQRAHPPHFGVQQAHGVVLPVVGAERVGAHQFGELAALVRRRPHIRAHLVQDDARARRSPPATPLRSPPGRRPRRGWVRLAWGRLLRFAAHGAEVARGRRLCLCCPAGAVGEGYHMARIAIDSAIGAGFGLIRHRPGLGAALGRGSRRGGGGVLWDFRTILHRHVLPIRRQRSAGPRCFPAGDDRLDAPYAGHAGDGATS